jgi:MFS superfamily sulfate permease-like transporter
MKLNLRSQEVISSVVVFLVALPLCLGVALASNAPISSGILAGIIGGVVIGLLGSSPISVSGPAAGLTMIVSTAITDLGSFPIFCAAVVFAGLLQIVLGIFKAGKLGDFFPSSVISGMLAAIGLILIIKQLPHAIGLDRSIFGDVSFLEHESENILTALGHGFDQSLSAVHWGATIICLFCIATMLLWDKVITKKFPQVKLIPSALLAVVFAIIINETIFPTLGLYVSDEHLVRIPYDGNWSTFFGSLSFPDFGLVNSVIFWKAVFTVGIVASLETLLSLDAATKIDPLKRNCNQNKELVAQGIGNTLCGLVGGLPVTAVIVRTTANVTAGALYKWSAVFHGLWLFLVVNLAPGLLSMIPLSALAAILLLVGHKLTSFLVIKKAYKKGFMHFIPFAVTIIAILATDLLVGIMIGMVIGIIFILKRDAGRVMVFTKMDDQFLIRFNKDISFLNKSELRQILLALPDDSMLTIDGSRSVLIDDDIIEVIEDFQLSASTRGIKVQLTRSPLALHSYFKIVHS